MTPSRVDSTRPEQDRVPELRKLPRKFEVKMDTLVRPVSRATANTEAAKVSKTIESINKKEYSLPANKVAGHSRAPSHQTITSRQPDGALERFPELDTDLPIPDSVVAPNNHTNAKALRTLGISESEPREQQKLPPASSFQTFTTKEKTPIASSMGSPSTFSFSINENLRRIAPGHSHNQNSNRHSVGDMNKLLEQNREATTAAKEKQQPPALTVRRSFSVGAESPTKSEAAPITSAPRPRRPSGKTTADRLAWIRALEEGSNRKGANSGREAMYKNLQGGVADKLARFESSNKGLISGTGPGLVRTNSVSSRMSAFSEAYGIENGAPGSRLSKASTLDEEFRRKMEEVAEKAKKKIEEDGDQEGCIKQVNRDAEMALAEEKRRSLKMHSGTFSYAFNDKAGRKTDLAPDATKTPLHRVKDPAAVAASANPTVDLRSFSTTPQGATKMPQFKAKDPKAVAASANPSFKLGEGKISAPESSLKDSNVVAAPANPPVSLDFQTDDEEYDPFNPVKYPVATSIPAIKRLGSSKTREELMAMEVPAPEMTGETKAEAVPKPMATGAPQTMEEVKATPITEPAQPVLSPRVEETKATPPSVPTQAEQISMSSPAPTTAASPSARSGAPIPAAVSTAKTATPRKDESSTPTPRYIALRERAQRAAELPVKTAPVPTSQTFSRLFGSPMASMSSPARAPVQKETLAKNEVPVQKHIQTTPARSSAPVSSKASPVAALATPSREEETPATPKMGGSSVGTTSGGNSPTTPTFTAARLPAFGCKA
jgi:hypothetical protein